tara:strand:- start:139 stop:543 length:405 start_codon:yes stop_codon:yes gene_type:complete
MNGRLLAVDVEIYKNWAGILKCKFISEFTQTGAVSGKVKITEHTINLMFTNRRAKGPFMIVLTNHHIPRLKSMRSGVVAGTTGDTGDPYCAKVLISKEALPEKDVLAFLKNYSSIIVEQRKSANELIALDRSNK